MITIAQLPPQPGNEDAADLVRDTVALTDSIAQEWELTWDYLFDPSDSGIWYGLVRLGLSLAAFSLLFVAIKDGKEIIDQQSWSQLVGLFAVPILIVIFLGANGRLLAQTTMTIRDVGRYEVNRVLSAQLGELTFREAWQRWKDNIGVRQELEALYAPCQGLSGDALIRCQEERRGRAEEISQRAEDSDWIPDWLGQAWGLINSPITTILRIILYSLQWCYVQALELSLMLTAVSGPIALGLSVLPLDGRPVIAWLVSYISVIGMQLGYNLSVGIMASVLTNAQADQLSEFFFLTFVSVFAPVLATTVVGLSGLAIWGKVNRSINDVKNAGLLLAGTAISAGAGAAIAGSRGALLGATMGRSGVLASSRLASRAPHEKLTGGGHAD